MKSLSSQAELSNVYTNHCIGSKGLEARHIMAVSGQNSEASIRLYSRNIAEQTRRDMSKALSSHMFSTTGDHHQPSDGNQSSQNQTIIENSQVLRGQLNWLKP